MAKDSEIEKALADRDIAAVTRMLDNGLDANWKDGEGNTLMHYAARFGDAAFIGKIASKGGHFLAFNDQHETPRAVAIIWGHDAVAAVILEEMQAELAPQPLAYKSLQEIRDASTTKGSSEFYALAAKGQFAQVAELAEKDAGGLTAADLLSTGPNGDTVALKLAQSGQLGTILKTSLWVSKPDDFQKIWDAVPKNFHARVDYPAFAAELRQARLQSYAKPKLQGLNRTPKPGFNG